MADRVQQLEEKIAHLERKVERLTAALEQAHETIERQHKEIGQLREENRILRKRLYGPKSDRPSDEAQLLLGGLFEVVQSDGDEGNCDESQTEASQPSPKPKDSKTRKANAKRLKLIDTGLEERFEIAEPDPNKVTDPITGER